MGINSNYSGDKNINQIVTDLRKNKAQQERLERMKEAQLFNREIYEKGTEYALQGYDLEDAGELSNNKDFLNGFARGLRLIKSSIDNSKKR